MSDHVPTSQAGRHVPFLDGWRGMAIALVLFSHFIAHGDMGADYGRLGVDVFFVLSGMLMGDLLFTRRVPIAAFYRRRISRVIPAFVLFVVAMFGAGRAFGLGFEGDSFLATLVFLRTYLPTTPDIWHTGLPIAHLWSLNVEEHCYLLMGLLAVFSKQKTFAAAVLMLAGCAALGMGVVYVRQGQAAPPLATLRSEVAASFVLLSAGYSIVKGSIAPRIPSWAPVLAFVAAGGCYYWRTPWWTYTFGSPILLSFAVNHLDRAPAAIRSMLSHRSIGQLGLLSFSIYLWQQPWDAYQSMFPSGVAMVGAIATGALSYYVVERPARVWLNAHWGRRRVVATPVVATP